MNYESNAFDVEIWIHGTAGDSKTPCGEVDILKLSGKNIEVETINHLIKQGNNGELLDCLNDLPTEMWLRLSIKYSYDDDCCMFERN